MSTAMPTLLVVEDDPQIRRFVRHALEREGFRVREAETFATGLIDAGTSKPDMVILDLGLPDLNGVEVTRQLREWTQIPIIILSVREHENDKIAALLATTVDKVALQDIAVNPMDPGEALEMVGLADRRHHYA